MTLRVLVAPAALRPGELVLDEVEHHYLARVRRAPVGAVVVAFDGQGRSAEGVIVEITDARTRLRIGEVVADPAPVPHITALVPLIKGERMDLCVEKLVEVGVDSIVLYEAERAVVKLAGARLSARRERMIAIVAAAARQSGRSATASVTGPVPIAEALTAASVCERRWVAVPGAAPPVVGSVPPRLAVLTGPEGGLTEGEVARATAAGFDPVGLGPFVLRAETAPIVAVAHARIACAAVQ
jgi:16S rRNA (uracil1498-N3)-methyltransferase